MINSVAILEEEREARRPVWRVARERCTTCDAVGVCVVHAEADHSGLQCVNCGAMTSVVTHWETSGDGEDPEWEPRILEDQLYGGVVPIRNS